MQPRHTRQCDSRQPDRRQPRSRQRPSRQRPSRRRHSPPRRKGAVVVFIAAILVALSGVAAFAVAVGYLAATRAARGAAADAGALAAAGSLSQSQSTYMAEAAARAYGQVNVPQGYGTVITSSDVTFGVWDPASQSFSAGGMEPNAVRVVARRTTARGNPVPYFLGRALGMQNQEMQVAAVAVGAVTTADSEYYNSVYVTSSKDLSNVVLQFADGTTQKFDNLTGYTNTFQGTGDNYGKEITQVWIKSGCNHSNDGPGYGELIVNDGNGTTTHGSNTHHGCTPHVTATFQATGVEFTESGASSPVRLVE